MAKSKTDICNIALASLGADRIYDFADDNKRARMCDVLYDSTRDHLLTKYDWTFARKFAKLVEVDVEAEGITIPPGKRAFFIPNDCKTPRDLYPEGSQDAWSILGRYLLTGLSGEQYLWYTAAEYTSSLFSDVFINVLALGLAVRLAPSITGSKSMAASLYKQYRIELEEAQADDATIGSEQKNNDDIPDNDTFVNPGGSITLSQEVEDR